MNKICLLILTIIFVSNVFASHGITKIDTIKHPTVPKEIVSSFSKTHPYAKLINWTKSNNIYIASYREENINRWTTYNSEGQLLETKWKVLLTELPYATQDFIRNNYRQGIQEHYKLIDTSGNVNYEVICLDKCYVFNSDGDLYKTKVLMKK